MQMVRRSARRSRVKKHSIVLRVLLVIFVVYLVSLVFSIVKVNAVNAAYEEEIARMDAAIVESELGNLELRDKTEHPDMYLDEIARENGYVKPGEEIFKETPGN